MYKLLQVCWEVEEDRTKTRELSALFEAMTETKIETALLAIEEKISLNNFVADSIKEKIFKEIGNKI